MRRTFKLQDLGEQQMIYSKGWLSLRQVAAMASDRAECLLRVVLHVRVFVLDQLLQNAFELL